MSQPLIDRGDGQDGFVPDGEFVVPGGDGSVASESVDAALHGLALLVDLRVERGRPAATAAFVLAVPGVSDRRAPAQPSKVVWSDVGDVLRLKRALSP